MLRELLSELMEGKERDVKRNELARVIGVSKQLITKFYSYNTELSFQNWILAIRYLRPEREDELVEIIAQDVIERGDRWNARTIMEYASTHRRFDLLADLVEFQRDGDRMNKDFAVLYDIALRFQQRSAPNEELLQEVDAFRTKWADAKVFASILRAYILYALKEYKTVFRLSDSIEKSLAEVTHPFIQESYAARLSEIMAQCYLFLKSDVRKARYYCNNVISSRFLGPEFKVHSYHLMGTSYYFESHEESVKWFTVYRDTLKGGGRHELARQVETMDIYFADVLWDKEVTEDGTDDALELAHYFARQGDAAKVEELCADVPAEDPFALCYRGIANNSPELLLQSMAKFIEGGNKFFAEVARREIVNYPAFTFSAEVLSSIKIA